MTDARLKEILDASTMVDVPELDTEEIHEEFVIESELWSFRIIGGMVISFDTEDEEITENFGLGNQTMVIGKTIKNVDVTIEETTMSYFVDGETPLKYEQHRIIEEFISKQINY